MSRALFGGSFDPFHDGHLAMISTALARGLAREVLVVPAGRNPHKADPPSQATHRLRMAELGTRGLAGVSVLDLEARRPGLSYTVETLEELVGRYPGEPWRVLLGADSLADFPRWQRPRRVLELADLIVFPRGGSPVTVPSELLGRVEVVAGFVAPVSSSEVRAALAAGQRQRVAVPPAVLAYIEAHGLYGLARGDAAPAAPGGEGARCP